MCSLFSLLPCIGLRKPLPEVMKETSIEVDVISYSAVPRKWDSTKTSDVVRFFCFNLDFFLKRFLNLGVYGKTCWCMWKIRTLGGNHPIWRAYFSPDSDGYLGVLTSHKGGAWWPRLDWVLCWLGENEVAVLVCCRCSLKSNMLCAGLCWCDFLLDVSTTKQWNSCFHLEGRGSLTQAKHARC